MTYRFMPALLLLALSTAAAQDVGAVPDPRALGASPFALGGFVLLIMATLKRAADRGKRVFSPWLWYGLALLLGEAGAWLLYASNFGAQFTLFGLGFPWTVAIFGLIAGAIGAGFRDLIKTIFVTWLGQSVPPDADLPLDKGGEGAAAAAAFVESAPVSAGVYSLTPDAAGTLTLTPITTGEAWPEPAQEEVK